MNINKEFISKVNTYQGQNAPVYIVIHETDNWNNGAGAQRHASAQAAGHLDTSVHYYSGSDGVYQAAEHNDGTYSVGREYGKDHAVKDANNRNTINIEICVNADGDYNTARANAIELVKYLMQTTGIPAGRVIRHFDAKGKYCPRQMLDNPALWEDFKAQIGQPAKNNPVVSQEAETWYRVGSSWANGVCQGQTGAYHNLDFAIADCKPGQNVYDSEGNIIHAGSHDQQASAEGYTQRQFIRDVQAATGSKVDGKAGKETIGNTVTVSRKKNKNHAVVTAIERRLKSMGYYTGVIEADEGRTPNFGPGMDTAVKSYQKDYGCVVDGEITSQKKTWKSLLGMI